MNKIILLAMLLSYSGLSLAFDWMPDRRKDQNPTQPAHLIVPLPYSKPGIGEGFVILGTVSNVAETTADISGVVVTGDASGTIINGSEVPLYSDILFLNFYLQNINRAAVNNYFTRGINDTQKDDYTVLDLSLAREMNGQLNLTFYERRLNFYYAYTSFKYQVDSIRDTNGALITTLGEPYVNSGNNDNFRVSFDLTDDYLDPRTGFRFDIKYQDHNTDNLNEPDYYTLDYNLLSYLPFNEADTLVLNYYQSDAHVRRQGNTDPTSIRAELDSNCAPTDTQCLDTEQQLVDNFISARTYGTSTSLGGDLRLRSFPQSRYEGAHTAFIGAEYRWNFTREVTPFDYFIWKDVRTGLQLAFFAEVGTVSETTADLWKETRHSLGTGIRLVAGSGAVYRADIATGDEGVEMIVIFDYPWE
jgi:outer membrane protein assembly factor BamA